MARFVSVMALFLTACSDGTEPAISEADTCYYRATPINGPYEVHERHDAFFDLFEMYRRGRLPEAPIVIRSIWFVAVPCDEIDDIFSDVGIDFQTEQIEEHQFRYAEREQSNPRIIDLTQPESENP